MDQTEEVTPQQIIQDLWVAQATQALIVGVELDVFTHILEGKRTAREIARRGIERLLDALVGLGYPGKNSNVYRLEPIAEKFLVRGKDS